MSLTYEDGLTRLAGKNQKKLENNTWLVVVNQTTLGIKLHETIVVYIFNNGHYQYQTGGWQTLTTKERINHYGPLGIHQEKGIWYIGKHIFADGVLMDSDGKVLNEEILRSPSEVQDKKRRLDLLVKHYIKGFGEHVTQNGLQTTLDKKPVEKSPWEIGLLTNDDAPHLLAPGAGDCWACWYGLDDHTTSNKEPVGVQHLIEHVTEDYFVPSLLWKAILTGGYVSPEFIWQSIAQQAQRGEINTLRDVLKKYFRDRKTAMLELL